MKKSQTKKNKYLIISNNLFSYNNANGKYLRNYLSFLDDDEICNFYISGENKSDSELYDSFCVTDAIALRLFKTIGLGKINIEKNTGEKNAVKNNSNHSALKHILRYNIWNSGFWKKTGFNKWIKSQNPKAIITLISNNPYLMKLAYQYSKELNIPLITFVCEDYPFKEYDYLTRSTGTSFFYKKFHKLTYKYTKKIFEVSKLVIFNSHKICNLYSNKVAISNSLICYPPSNINIIPLNNVDNFLYAGNLGLGRVDALIELAEVLKDLKFTQKIDIYGNLTEEQKKKIIGIDNIVYHGHVSNNELMGLYSKAGILLHIEHDSEYNKIDLEYAFSTKIADMVCSGKRIMLYAPKDLCETEYFIKNLPNNVATSKKELFAVLKYVTSNIYDFSIQAKVAKNHNIEEVNNTLEREIRKL